MLQVQIIRPRNASSSTKPGTAVTAHDVNSYTWREGGGCRCSSNSALVGRNTQLLASAKLQIADGSLPLQDVTDNEHGGRMGTGTGRVGWGVKHGWKVLVG